MKNIHCLENRYSNLSAPFMMTWEITSACNLNCIHCSSDSGVRKNNELSTQECRGLIDQLSRLKVFWIEFSGGEPLIRNDFFDVAMYAKSKGLDATLFTNGTLVDEEKARKIKELEFRDVAVSIDGLRKTHNEIRGRKDAFEEAIEGVRNLVACDVKVSMVTVLMRKNFSEIQELIDLAVRIGAKGYRFLDLIPIGRAKNNLKTLWLPPEKRREVVASLKKKSVNMLKEINISAEVPLDFPFGSASDRHKMDFQPSTCVAAKLTCKTDSEGWVSPCPLFGPEMSGGNIREKGLEDIWRGSEVFLKLRNIDHLEGKCRSCSFLEICKGGCRAAAYAYFGNIHASDPRCWIK